MLSQFEEAEPAETAVCSLFVPCLRWLRIVRNQVRNCDARAIRWILARSLSMFCVRIAGLSPTRGVSRTLTTRFNNAKRNCSGASLSLSFCSTAGYALIRVISDGTGTRLRLAFIFDTAGGFLCARRQVGGGVLLLRNRHCEILARNASPDVSSTMAAGSDLFLRHRARLGGCR